ncbi:MAG: sigma-70 family RNA polymerase sigma factor [Planctomycetota bacterium]
MSDARTDRELLAAHLGGESGAFEALASRHLPMVLGACRRLLGGRADAEDAAQAVFMILVRKAPALSRGTGDLGAWLHRTARFAARTELRTRTTRARHEREAAAMRERTGPEGKRREDLPEGLDAALDALPGRNRQVLVLCYFEGLSQRQAAKRLGVPASTVAMRCSKGLERLRAKLNARDRRRFGAAALGALLAGHAAEAAGELPPNLLPSVVAAANGAAVSSAVTAITEGALKMILWSKAKVWIPACAALLALAVIGPLALRAMGGAPGRPPAAKAARPGPAPAEPGPAEPKPVEAAPTPAPVPAQRPAASEAGVMVAAKSANAFGLDLYAKLAEEKKGENVFFSPFSISTALSMTYAGARGNTAAQMKKVLRYELADAKVHAAVGAMVEDMNAAGAEGKFQLSVANALWGQKNYKFLDPFLALNKRDYGAGFRLVDYAGDTEGARKEINAWVEEKTRDKVKELLKPGILDALTRLVLTNAVYFKADWEMQFDSRSTRERPFRLAGGKAVKAPTMSRTDHFLHAAIPDSKLQLAELAYKGDRFAMVILLPDAVDGLPALEKSLTAEKISDWVGLVRKRRVMVSLPKFSVTSEFRLDKQLKALGMPDAFNDATADFSGIDGKKHWLYIQAVVHKAFVDVTERGTEAGAATAVVMGVRSMPPQFTCDRPFLYLIRDKVTGAILFMGRVTDPTQ